MGAKIEKTLRISQRGGMDNKSNLFANNMSKRITANIVNKNGKTKPLPVMLSRRIIWAIVKGVSSYISSI